MTRSYTAFVGACFSTFFLLAGSGAADGLDHPLHVNSIDGYSPTASVVLAQAQSESATTSKPKSIEGDLVRAILSARFLFDANGRPVLVVDWWVSATRPDLHINGNTDIEVRVGSELIETMNFTGVASHSGVCAGGICSGCPIGLICSGGYCLCDNILNAISEPMNIQPGDRVNIRLAAARGGVRDFDRSDNRFEVVYTPQSKEDAN